jgi:hypothetical protein
MDSVLDIDVEDFKSFLCSVDTLLMMVKNQPGQDLQRIRLAVAADCEYFSNLIVEAEAK